MVYPSIMYSLVFFVFGAYGLGFMVFNLSTDHDWGLRVPNAVDI